MEKDLLPEHYTYKNQPYYKGDGVLNVTQLETLAKDFTEYVHQQAIIKDKLIKALNEINNIDTSYEKSINDTWIRGRSSGVLKCQKIAQEVL